MLNTFGKTFKSRLFSVEKNIGLKFIDYELESFKEQIRSGKDMATIWTILNNVDPNISTHQMYTIDAFILCVGLSDPAFRFPPKKREKCDIASEIEKFDKIIFKAYVLQTIDPLTPIDC